MLFANRGKEKLETNGRVQSKAVLDRMITIMAKPHDDVEVTVTLHKSIIQGRCRNACGSLYCSSYEVNYDWLDFLGNHIHIRGLISTQLWPVRQPRTG